LSSGIPLVLLHILGRFDRANMRVFLSAYVSMALGKSGKTKINNKR